MLPFRTRAGYLKQQDFSINHNAAQCITQSPAKIPGNRHRVSSFVVVRWYFGVLGTHTSPLVVLSAIPLDSLVTDDGVKDREAD